MGFLTCLIFWTVMSYITMYCVIRFTGEDDGTFVFWTSILWPLTWFAAITFLPGYKLYSLAKKQRTADEIKRIAAAESKSKLKAKP